MSSFLVSSTDSLFNGSFFRAGRAPGLSSSLSLLRDSTDSLMLGPVASSFPLLGEQEGEEERGGVRDQVDDEGEASPIPGEGEAPGLRADLRWSASSGDEGAQSREEEQVAYEAYAAAAASSSVAPSLMAGVGGERESVRTTVQVLPVASPTPTPLVHTAPSAPPRPTTTSSSSSSSSSYSPSKRREDESGDEREGGESESESESESERRGRKPVAYGTTVSLSGLQMDPAAPVALRRVRLTKMHLLCVSLETMDEFMCKCEQELAGPAITGAEQRELRRQRRLVRNRIYAAESRKRKRREIAREKSDLTTLRAENDGLRERVRELEAQLAAERGAKRGRR